MVSTEQNTLLTFDVSNWLFEYDTFIWQQGDRKYLGGKTLQKHSIADTTGWQAKT